MSLNINEVTIAGNICSDLEIRQAGSSQVLNLSVATNERWTDKSGQKQEKAEFHNCQVWGKQAEIIHQYFKKGDPIYLKGKLVTDKYEKEGSTRYATKIQCFSFQFVASKPKNETGYQQGGGYQQPQQQGGNQWNGQQSPQNFNESSIPF